MTKKQKKKILKCLIDDGGIDWATDDKEFWKFISKNFNLYDDFVREYRDCLNWEEICKNQIITNSDMLREFRKEINWTFLGCCSSTKLSKEQKKEFHNELYGWEILEDENDI